ncbi:hypothetical protein M1328_05490 [Patescibacteria group bacterium]|nr:hypothetical protein [Patescibacteria group bacterium]
MKIKLKDLVSRKIVDILVSNTLPYKEIQEMAVDLVDALNEVKTKEDLIKLIDALPTVYPYLKNEAFMMNQELSELKQQAVIGKLENYFKNFSHN